MSSFHDEYYCPHCGAILNDQIGFSPENDTWTCVVCGQELFGDDIYSGDLFDGVMWYCDGCGALLNKQTGFSDYYSSWCCSQCGYLNTISEDNIYESHDAYESQKDSASWESDEDDADCEEEYDDDDCGEEYDETDYSYGTDSQGYNFSETNEANSSDDIKSNRRQDRPDKSHFYKTKSHTRAPKRPRHVKDSKSKATCGHGMSILFSILLMCFCIGLLYWMSFDSVKIPLASGDCIGKNYQTVQLQFSDAGFNNVKTIPVEDLKDGFFFKDTKKNNTIQSITVKGNIDFKEGETYGKDDPVTIYYHTYPRN